MSATSEAGPPTAPGAEVVDNERIEHEHADVTGGWLRPAVFGASDGLVSNFALIAGVTGGSGDNKVVLLAGLAGLAGGALSMAAGEYISVRSQAEQAQGEIEIERLELERRPKAEERELAQMYVAKGLDPELARQVAAQLSRNPKTALDIHVREELGIDLAGLPSARLAATWSFLSFAIGAAIPVLPYLFGADGVIPSLVVTLLGLFLCGAFVTRLTPRKWWYGGARQVLVGAAAAAATYGLGSAVGAAGLT